MNLGSLEEEQCQPQVLGLKALYHHTQLDTMFFKEDCLSDIGDIVLVCSLVPLISVSLIELIIT